jgi:hypothetical protein
LGFANVCPREPGAGNIDAHVLAASRTKDEKEHAYWSQDVIGVLGLRVPSIVPIGCTGVSKTDSLLVAERYDAPDVQLVAEIKEQVFERFEAWMR